MLTAKVAPVRDPIAGQSEKPDAEKLIRRVADTVHRLNEQIAAAVKAGVTVELVRSSRVHDGVGQWGDQMAPVIHMADHEDRD